MRLLRWHWPWLLAPSLTVPISWWVTTTQYLVGLFLTPLIYAGGMLLQRAWQLHRFPAYDPTKHKLRDD